MDSKTAYQKLQEARSSSVSAPDMYKTQEDQLGLGAMREGLNSKRNLVRTTEDALRGVEASVTGRTQGSLVTEAQRSRLSNLERAPIAQTLNDQQSGLSDDQAAYRDLLAEAGTRTGLQYQSQADRLKSLETDYQTALQAELEQQKLAEQRASAGRDTSYINDLIAKLTGGGNNTVPAVQSATTTAGIPAFTVDQSRGLNMNQVKPGGIKTLPSSKKKSSPINLNTLTNVAGLLNPALIPVSGLNQARNILGRIF